MGKKIKTGVTKKKMRFNLLKTDEEFSGDVLLNLPQVVLSGDKSALIEGKVSILEYDSEVVKIAFKSGYISFFGDGFSISTFSDNKISFSGKISSIEFS